MSYLPWIMLILGVLTRMIAPYLIELYKANKNDEKLVWKWVYLRGQIILSAAILLLLPFLVEDLSAVGTMAPQLAWTTGFSIAAIGRELDKLFEVIIAK